MITVKAAENILFALEEGKIRSPDVYRSTNFLKLSSFISTNALKQNWWIDKRIAIGS